MAVRKELASFLYGKPAIEALVGRRIYPLAVEPDKPLPAVVFAKEPHRSHEFHLDGPANYDFSLIRFDAIAPTYGQAWAIANAIRDVLNGESGFELSGRIVDQCELIDSWDADERDEETDALTAYVAVQLFEFMTQPLG